MRKELLQQGATIKFVAINAINANKPENRKSLTDRCSFPLFQDTEEVQAWAHHSGQKDDFYVYDKEGKLVYYLPIDGTFGTDLFQPENYKAFKALILSVK